MLRFRTGHEVDGRQKCAAFNGRVAFPVSSTVCRVVSAGGLDDRYETFTAPILSVTAGLLSLSLAVVVALDDGSVWTIIENEEPSQLFKSSVANPTEANVSLCEGNMCSVLWTTKHGSTFTLHDRDMAVCEQVVPYSRFTYGLETFGFASDESIAVGRLDGTQLSLTRCSSIRELRGTRFVDMAIIGGALTALTNAGFVIAFSLLTGAVEKWMDCKICPAVHLTGSSSLVVVGNIIRFFDAATWTFQGKVENNRRVGGLTTQSFLSGLLETPSALAVACDSRNLVVFGARGDISEFELQPRVENGKIRITAIQKSKLGNTLIKAHDVTFPNGNKFLAAHVDDGLALFTVDDRTAVVRFDELVAMGSITCVRPLDAHSIGVASGRTLLVVDVISRSIARRVDVEFDIRLIAANDSQVFIVGRSTVEVRRIVNGELQLIHTINELNIDAADAAAVDDVLCLMSPNSLLTLSWDANDSVHADAPSGCRHFEHGGWSGANLAQARHRLLWANDKSVVAFDPVRQKTAELPTSLPGPVVALHVEHDLDLLAAAGTSAVVIVCLQHAVVLHRIELPFATAVRAVTIITSADTLLLVDQDGRVSAIELLVDHRSDAKLPSPLKQAFAGEEDSPRHRDIVQAPGPAVGPRRASSHALKLVSPLEDTRIGSPIGVPESRGELMHSTSSPGARSKSASKPTNSNQDSSSSIGSAVEDSNSRLETTCMKDVQMSIDGLSRLASALPEVHRESMATSLRELASQLEREPPPPRRATAAHAAHADPMASSVDFASMQSELRLLRSENARISRQNEEILSLLRKALNR